MSKDAPQHAIHSITPAALHQLARIARAPLPLQDHTLLHLPARVRKRVVLAIDSHHDPYYGYKSKPGVVGGPKEAGTKYAHAHAYATACAIEKRQRSTLGLVRVKPKEKSHEVVVVLLGVVESRGIRIEGVVLDAGFDPDAV